VLIINRLEAGGTTAEEREEARPLMNLARLNGFVGERKLVVSTPLRLDQFDSAELRAEVGTLLDALEPGAQADIRVRLAAGRARRPAIDATVASDSTTTSPSITVSSASEPSAATIAGYRALKSLSLRDRSRTLPADLITNARYPSSFTS